MKDMTIANVVGARPQFVKAAMLSKAIAATPRMREIIIHSGQHYDRNMSSIFFDEMEIPKPDISLNISGGSHGRMIGEMLIAFEEVFMANAMDYVVVYGDTNTSLAAALAAKKLNIPVVHVEAGVRNYDERMPEEVNRYLIDRMSAINFCCTTLGEENLRQEGYYSGRISSEVFNCGDLMYDATLHYEKRARKGDVLADLGLQSGKFVLCTIHRASNTDDAEKLHAILDAMEIIGKTMPILFPIHPRTRACIGERTLAPSIRLMDPVGYLDMLSLIANSSWVMTDSGGLVREAYFLGKPCLLTLKHPLWPELVHAGVCINTEPDTANIMAAAEKMPSIEVSSKEGIFGDGHAARHIVDRILEHHKRQGELA